MKPAAFDYHAPATLAEAVQIIGDAEDARVLAGGQSLVPMLAIRLAQPQVLVDLNGIPELGYIRRDNGHVAIGAMTRQRQVEQDPLIRQAVPVLAAAVEQVGHVTIRNRGTVGGSVAHADPAAELPTVMVGLRASLVVTGPAGSRVVPAAEFFQSYFTTSLQPGEILTELRVPVSPPRTGWAFEELARRHGDFAVAAVMATTTLAADGRIAVARLAIAGAGPTPIAATAAEAALVGHEPSAAVITEAAAAVAAASQPVDDIHGTADYRRHVVAVLARRALSAAVTRAKEQS